MIYPGFIGATDRVSARTVNAERTINWYPELATGTPKAKAWLVPTPGLDPFVVLGAGPVRALYAEENRCFAVGGGNLYEVMANQTFVFRGEVGMDGRPASISSNGSDGRQLFVVSNGDGFIFDLTTDLFTPIIDDGFPRPVSMGAFIDGYFLALQAQSDKFQISELENGLVWDALDVAQVSHTTGIVRAMVPVHRELWLLGTSTTTVWADIGDPDFPFAPIPGAFIQQGIGSLFGWTVVDNALFWHGQNEDGGRVAYRAQGYTPQRISTHAVEQAWAEVSTLQDVICWSYQDRGHAFVVFYLPAAETTWVYDVSTQAWHERALWDPTALVWTPHLARCHAFAFDKHLVGDRSSPAIYHLDAHTHSDGIVVAGLMAAPVNDTCATATVIAALPFSATVDVTDATSGDGPVCIPAEHSIWYSWTAPDATPVVITFADNRSWGTALAIYTGSCAGLTTVVCTDAFPATYAFVPTAAVAYLLQVGVYENVLGTYPSVSVTVTLAASAPPPAPVLSGVSTTGRTVTLSWASLAGTTAETVSIERSLNGTTWTVVTSVGIGGPYHDRALSSATVYHHRVRGHHATLGYGAYSNIVTTTTLAATVGIVQYAFAIGGTGGFGRNQTIFEDGTADGYPATFEVYGVCQLWEVVNAQETQPGGPGTTIYRTAKLLLQYVAGNTVVSVVSAGYVLDTLKTVFVGPSDLPQAQYINLNHQIDLWGTLGSADTLTGTHAADGSLTVRLDGAVIFALTDIALGTNGTAGWSNVRVHPAGTRSALAADGSGILENGGLTHFYVGTSGVAGAHDAFDYTFATLTDDDLFGDDGPWLQLDGLFGPSTVPTLWDGKLSDSSETTGFTVGWMHLKPTEVPVPVPPPWVPPVPEPEPEPEPPIAPGYHLEARYIRRLRRAPHVNNDNLRVFYRRFELDLERGQALASGQGSEPYVLLRLSRDGGQTWGEEMRMAAGKLGEYQARVMARRLGQARDTVFEVVVSDPVAWSLVGAWLDLEPGTS